MPRTEPIDVKNLRLDLNNFRTVPQTDESAALEAMISTSPDRFWALMDSLLEDGYLPTENVIVLEGPKDGNPLVVREGNRRVAALKMALGLLSSDGLAVPEDIATRIANCDAQWKLSNRAVPCSIYRRSDAKSVDRIVTLAHGKNEKAGRDQWNAVARARHNRDVSGNDEPALDLLEAYLNRGKNLTATNRSRWAGDYPLSVLADAMKRLAPRIGLASSSALAKAYPAISHRDAIESVLLDIGNALLGFDGIRSNQKDVFSDYGVPILKNGTTKKAGQVKSTATGSGSSGNKATVGGNGAGSKSENAKASAVATTDQRSVRRILKAFTPKGKKREKVVALKDEAVKLDLVETPFAFCFVLRSLFEVSAKAYCGDHAAAGGPAILDKHGTERSLRDVLQAITGHLTGNNADKEKVKMLHGAMTELARTSGLLSVTSLNQLIHNQHFSIAPGDIARLFGNVFPLLEEMNS